MTNGNELPCNCSPIPDAFTQPFAPRERPVPQFFFPTQAVDFPMKMSTILRLAKEGYLRSIKNPAGRMFTCDAIDEFIARNSVAKEAAVYLKRFIQFKLDLIYPDSSTLWSAHYKRSGKESFPRNGIFDPEWFVIRDEYLLEWEIELRAKGY